MEFLNSRMPDSSDKRPANPLKGQANVFQNVMSRKQRHVFLSLVTIWLISLVIFLEWWFQSSHVAGWFKYILNTALLLWVFALPGYFFFFVYRMKRINPDIEIPGNWRVAMVTTRAPSEAFEVVRKTLESMLDQPFPHDTWLADEDPDDQILEWCALKGIQVSCRKGVAEYHNSTWPRRTKCKEGNLAYFYDKFGYDRYDIVVQLDADHIPSPCYLEAILRPFIDPAIGYVAAPSICNSNAKNSWSARGRLYAESIMHGPLQSGYSGDFAPLCIGSHYAVRTVALKEIGGLGPELAEDHSTTLMMNGFGWRGAFAFDAHASGEGPPSVSDCITQEFQWSRSLMVLMLTEMPKYWRKLSRPLKIQFLFSQLWYPLFGINMLIGSALPLMAVISKQTWVSVSFIEFLLRSVPLTASILGVVWYLKRNGWLKPFYSPIISWEAMLFQLMRWPWALYGSVMGILLVLTKKKIEFKVTPKGNILPSSVDWSVLAPYYAMILISSLPVLLIRDAGHANGYIFFLIIQIISYVILIFSLILIQLHESRQSIKSRG